MTSRSPFQYNRWETDDEHIIWLPSEFSEWERKRCVYFTGSRGTGKTTLLRGFEWHERLKNSSLRAQVNANPFEKCYVGVYLNMPDYVTKHFINWPSQSDNLDDIQLEEERARVYSLYIEYQILQLFIEAIQGLRGEKILEFSPEHEIKSVEEILLERSEINYFLKYSSPDAVVTRLNDLRLCFKRMHENIRFCAIHEMELQPKRGYPVLQMGKMLEETVGMLLNLCSKNEKNDGENAEMKNWTLKVCIDQNESSEAYQQKAINTMVARQETGDISFAIASLSGNIDINAAYIPRHSLTDADRAHYLLEEVYGKDAKFHEFVTSVTELRFKKFMGTNDVSVDLKHLLGEWDINALLYPILKQSEKEVVREFIKKSNENIGIKFFDFKRKDLPLEQLNEMMDSDDCLSNEQEEPNIPPFYQTYLVDKLKLKLPQDTSEIYEIRAQKSREIRKKMVAAMLCLCNEYELSVPYAGYNMVIRMSDNCIRDFLRQMHEIYIIEKSSAEIFLTSQINIQTQHEGILKASINRYEGISTDTPGHVLEVKKLVDTLGEITAKIQSAYKDPSSLKTIEKGRFNIDYSQMKDDDKRKLVEILNMALDSHYIKKTTDFSDGNIGLFRLHRLFAPKFRFSYRGALSNASLLGNDLLKLCDNDDETKRDNILNKIISKIVKIDHSAEITKLDQFGVILDD